MEGSDPWDEDRLRTEGERRGGRREGKKRGRSERKWMKKEGRLFSGKRKQRERREKK